MADELEELIVRDAKFDDAETIARIHTLSWQQAYAGYVPAAYLKSLTPETKTPVWEGILQRDDTTVLVAENSGRLLGFVSIGPAPDEDAEPQDLCLYTMYLDPEAWGRGVAKQLMSAVNALVPSGAALTLWVFDKNERARRFYEHHGFKLDGVEKLEEFAGEYLLELRYRK
ncbi:GNAT family N-acetyltransferase [Timonella sp. A28]|uniref:GNAT family N-acetyltransferase n=1 Tax=Timonella sp. A28 TaxID=3442640 RepID=UPI003EBD9ABF